MSEIIFRFSSFTFPSFLRQSCMLLRLALNSWPHAFPPQCWDCRHAVLYSALYPHIVNQRCFEKHVNYFWARVCQSISEYLAFTIIFASFPSTGFAGECHHAWHFGKEQGGHLDEFDLRVFFLWWWRHTVITAAMSWRGGSRALLYPAVYLVPIQRLYAPHIGGFLEIT